MKISARTHPPPLSPLSYRLTHAILWPVMKITGISCRHFAGLASTRLDRPLTRMETLRFHLHRASCSLCHPLPAQLEHLRDLARRAGGEAPPGVPPPAELDDEALARIRSALEKAAEGEASQLLEESP